MRKLAFAVSALLISSSNLVLANMGGTTTTSANTINTQASHWSISTSTLSMGLGSGANYISMSPRIEYFVADNIAVGMEVGFTNIGTPAADIMMGPAATYHFWQQDEFSAYGGAAYTFSNLNNRANAGVGQTLSLNGGANYNFASWFGIGPRMTVAVPTNTKAAAQVQISAINLYFYL